MYLIIPNLECDEIKEKFESTSTKISSSLTNLSQLVNSKANEQDAMVADIGSIRQSMEDRQTRLESELAENQQKIDEQLEELNKKMTEAIEDAKREAMESGGCCTIA